jgi:hypothetical protein
MNRLFQCALVIASLVSDEGLSFAQTSSPKSWAPLWTKAGISVVPRGSSSISTKLHDPALTDEEARTTMRVYLGWRDSAEGMVGLHNGSSLVSLTEGTLAAIRFCHISRHPRDGIRAALHACPLLVADVDMTASPAPNASVALVPLSSVD